MKLGGKILSEVPLSLLKFTNVLKDLDRLLRSLMGIMGHGHLRGLMVPTTWTTTYYPGHDNGVNIVQSGRWNGNYEAR